VQQIQTVSLEVSVHGPCGLNYNLGFVLLIKGAVYHIPVVLWLLDTHPHNAPMVFVTPTSDMRIKVSRHVDHNGKVYLPYLHDWNPVRNVLIRMLRFPVGLISNCLIILQLNSVK